MTPLALYLEAILVAGAIYIFVPGPVGDRAREVFYALIRRAWRRDATE